MRVKPLIAVPLIAIALAGCSTQQPTEETSTAAAQEQPLFSSDEEALAAAQAAYANYLVVSDQIARDGGANPERLKGLVSTQLFEESADVYKTYKEQSITVEGATSFDSLHIGEISQNSASYYVCLDVGKTKLLNADGIDVTPVGRQSRLPIIFEVRVTNSSATIESSEVWSGRNYC
ncbi:hypothetical protein [Aurantimicrobium minutum]|uniref:hypothetical protein n=1 Tax=Aurantimicrobium minutum TaxID=708131 RepID=UPI0024754E6C|nr:hypothetical protein [Aurantimicrobium minutum]